MKKKIAIFGGGPACLMAALQLAPKHEVVLYEKGKTIGRKFLVAGKGGFNLTNGAVGTTLINAYDAPGMVKDAVADFDSVAVRNWLADLGIETFIGSSGRVFPVKGIKPVEVLKAIENKLISSGVEMHKRSPFVGFNEEGMPLVEQGGEISEVRADHFIFGLGGASWSITGSAGDWTRSFEKIGVKTLPFQASNCGILINWPGTFGEQYAGQPLKNIALTAGGKQCIGEALITSYGLEGNAVYPLSGTVRKVLEKNGTGVLYCDFKPQNTIEELVAKVGKKAIRPKNYAYTFNLKKPALNCVKNTLDKEAYFNPVKVAEQLKKVPLQFHGLRPIEEAISTVGGISFEALNPDFTLKKWPRISVIGEMLDWDAPTGGFLLQACFAMGVAAARRLG